MRLLVPLVLMAVIFSGCAHFSNQKPDHFYSTISIPQIPLADGERIQSVQVTIASAQFWAINRLPDDWTMELAEPTADFFTFKASANHESSALHNSEGLDKFISIMDCEPSRFSIQTVVGISLMDKVRTVSIPQSELILKREKQRDF